MHICRISTQRIDILFYKLVNYANQNENNDYIFKRVLTRRFRLMMYDALDIAAYVIKQCHKKETTISNLKLQKILYFIQAEFLVKKGVPCFNQAIEAWDFGPVVPEVYHKFKVYGGAAIPFAEEFTHCDISDEDKKLIKIIINVCSKYSAAQLVEITHRQSPWKNAYQKHANIKIKNKDIKKFFAEG